MAEEEKKAKEEAEKAKKEEEEQKKKEEALEKKKEAEEMKKLEAAAASNKTGAPEPPAEPEEPEGPPAKVPEPHEANTTRLEGDAPGSLTPAQAKCYLSRYSDILKGCDEGKKPGECAIEHYSASGRSEGRYWDCDGLEDMKDHLAECYMIRYLEELRENDVENIEGAKLYYK